MEVSTRTNESFIVKKSEPVLIYGVRRTSDGDSNYFLSNLDQHLCHPTSMIFRFKADETKRNQNFINVIKDALAKVLVEYYPYTGRVTVDPKGRFMIKCTGEGVPFVEAHVEEEIEVLGDITIFNPALEHQLVYFVDGVEDVLEILPLTVQVTKFKCGGFVIGLGMNNLMNDGTTMGQFMNSWAETVRGVTLTIPPFLDRAIIRPKQPLKIKFPHHEYAEEEEEDLEITTTSDELIYGSFCFHPKVLTPLKSTVCNDLSKCPTNFELVMALMWRYRIMALKVEPNEKVKLNIIVSIRNKLKGFLPKGYFGNGFVFSCCHCNAGELIQKPVSFAVKLIQEAIELVTETYLQSYISYIEVKRKEFASKHTCYVSKIARLPLYDADFGWGNPTQVAVGSISSYEVHYLSQGKDTENVVLLLALPASAMKIFQELIRPQLSRHVSRGA